MGKKQDESLKYMKGNYSNIQRLWGEFLEDAKQADEMMNAEEYWKEYMESEKKAREEHHYLVEGAVLTCTACTMKPVRPFKEEFIAPEGSNERRLKITEERGFLNGAGQRFATVKDRVKWENIEPFGNCKNPPNRQKEIKDVQMAETSEELRKGGTCVYLMDIRDDWENLLGESGYDSCPFCTDMEDGITMEASLFCSHGGFIYPKSSGYIPTEDKVLTLPDPGNPDEVIQYLWDYFRQQGFSEVAVAGILGNASVESKFDPKSVNKKSEAIGLFQWVGDRKVNLKAFAKEMTGDEENWEDIAVQCEFVMKEYEFPGESGWLTKRLGYPGEEILVGTQENFENTQEPSETALIWATSFERCYVNEEKDKETGIDPDGPGFWYNEDGLQIYYNLQGQQERQNEAERIYELMTRED